MRHVSRYALGCCLAVAVAMDGRAQTLPAQVTASGPTSAVLSEQPPAKLTVWNRTLAILRTSLGSASAQQRADAASARIESALDTLSPAAVRYAVVQVGNDRGALIIGDAETLFAVLEGDLPQDNARSLDAAGAQAVIRLQTLLRERSEQRRWPVFLSHVLQALLATVAFALFWFVSWRALQWLRDRLSGRDWIRDPAIPGINARGLLLAALKWVVRLTTLAIRLAGAYLFLTFVFSRFAYSLPWSQALGRLLIDTATRMMAAVVDQIPNLISLGMILFVARAVARAVAAWFRSVERGDLEVSWLDPVAASAGRRLTVLAIWLFALTVAYPFIPGANTDAFKGLSVFIGLVLSLGSAGVVNQIMSGLFVTFNRALRPGDFVNLGDVQGVVKQLGLVSVTIATRNHQLVTIPNAVVVAHAIKNFSRAHRATIALSTSVTIGYDTPWRQVRAMLLLAASRTDGVLSEPSPVVFETALSDFYIEYELVVHAGASVSPPQLLSRLHEQILDEFNHHGVQIMSPHFEGQPEHPTTVDRSNWFAAPAARADTTQSDS